MSARASKRAQNALYGRATGQGSFQTQITITSTDGRKTTTTAGSVINWGGDDKGGLYPTVGVSVGFLNLLSNCCGNGKAPSNALPRSGVNTSPWNKFMDY